MGKTKWKSSFKRSVSATKIAESATNILELMFFTLNLQFVKSNQISIVRKLNLPLTRSIYFVFLLLEMQKRLKKTKVYHLFSYFVWKETTHKPVKVAAAKSCFSSVYVIGKTCFDEIFLFFVITGRYYFSWKFIVTVRPLKRHVAPFFEAAVLKEVRILCIISTIIIWC